jgi:hypothetical protein
MSYRKNALDQALDIAGSLIKNQNANLTDEVNSLGSPISGQAGAALSIDAVAVGVVTVSGLTGMTTASIGRFVTISGADDPDNNGTFLISAVNSATEIEFVNASAVFPDANSGSISWEERNPYSIEDDMNFARTDRAAIKGVDYHASIPTYVRPEDTSTTVAANLANIAGHTTDAKAIVTNRKFENISVAMGDSFVTLTDVGNLKHADSVDITGVPIWDGYDSGNWESTYVELYSDLENELIAVGGAEDGYRIFARARAGSEMSPDSIELEFRAVPLGMSITASVPYTWDGDQPTNIHAIYPYRQSLHAMDENALRVLLVNGLVGDVNNDKQGIEDLYTLVGVASGSTDLSTALTNTGNYFPFSDLPDATPSIVEALNVLNEQIGDRTYTGGLLTSGESITTSLQALSTALEDANFVRIIERVTSGFNAGTAHTIPGGASYTIDATNNGQNMLVFARGLLRDPGPVSGGNEYQETSTTEVTFYFRINNNDHINYLIYK